MAKRKKRRARSNSIAPARAAPTAHAAPAVSIAKLFAAAVQHHQTGRIAEAEPLYRQVLALDSNHVECLHNLGILAHQIGHNDRAEDLVGRAIAINPSVAEAHNSLGNILRDQGKLNEAAASYQRAIALKPNYAMAHYNLGVAFQDQDRLAEAAASYQRAIVLKPDYAEAHNNLGNVLRGQSKLADAAASYQRAIVLKPDYAETHSNLGNVLRDQGKSDEAAVSHRRAIALKPGFAEAHSNLGNVLRDQGQLDEAAASYRRAIALKPDYADAYYYLAGLRPIEDGSLEGEGVFALLSRQADRLDQFAPRARSTLLFAMGKALEDRGEFDRAFACLAQANAIHRAGLSFDIAEAERQMDSIAKVFDVPLFERLKGAGAASERPIFIIGMLRSGSTLAEQIISAHPDVHGAGEIANLSSLVGKARGRDGSVFPLWAETMSRTDCRAIGQAYLDSLPSGAPHQSRVTDKLLNNLVRIGLIHLCLPNARIIHCQRDPRDVCLSCFASRFASGHDYAYDLAELGRYWRAYDRLMAHWRTVLPPGRMLDVPYEAVVEDVDSWARRLIAHCGLAWDDACLRFHESRREVRTASFAQVRRPIYGGSVGRWRSFACHLGPLLEALGEPWTGVAGFPASCAG